MQPILEELIASIKSLHAVVDDMVTDTCGELAASKAHLVKAEELTKTLHERLWIPPFTPPK